MRVEVSVVIEAEPEKVWAEIVDVERWHEWTESITSIELLSDGPLHEGSRARVKQPRLLTATWEVTEIDDGHGFTWESTVRGLHSFGVHGVEPVPGGAKATLALEQRGILATLASPFTRPMVRKYVEMEAAGLRQRVLDRASAGGGLADREGESEASHS